MDDESLKWILGIGFSGLGSLMLYLNHSLSHGLNLRMDKLDARMDRFEEKLTDVDRRLCRIEGAMMNKDCCMLKHEHKEKAD